MVSLSGSSLATVPVGSPFRLVNWVSPYVLMVAG